jgi:hypothetical protein
VQTWSDEEVARRWLRLFPKRKREDGSPEIPNQADLQLITGDPKRVEELRRRLSDISWWMRCTAESIARRANREDECTGRFWEGRFRAQLLLDEASMLACAAYVDLNPIRAALAETLETSDFTGAKDRIDDLQAPADRAGNTHAWERGRRRCKSGWMSPLEIDERLDPLGPDPDPTARRASQKGFLPISLARYLELLDWTGRQLRATKRGAVPSHLAPILTRLGMDSEDWCQVVGGFGRVFRRVAGTPASLQAEATRRGQRSMHAPGRRLFSAAA